MVGSVTNTLAISVALVLGAGVAAAFAHVSLQGPPSIAPPGPTQPETLRGTGFSSVERVPFTPQYPLWSDGATKRRWIYLPPGQAIDASDIDAWQFPVGTRLWKELSFGGHRVETRYMARAQAGWVYATYVWNDAGTEATLAPAAGATSVEIAPGVRHHIPSVAECRACHAVGRTPALAFSALQLSSDRDPNAPHREVPLPGSLDLRDLVVRGLVANVPATSVFGAPRIPGDAVERAALGYLHANCGGCHRSDGPIGVVGMDLVARLADPGTAKRTTIEQPAHFMAPRMRIAPGDPARSVVIARMSSRDPTTQMPPLGTQLVDTEATDLLTTWIAQLERNP
jgi:hypothetical protein